MDIESRERWQDFSRAKDEMFAHTDIKQAPWWVVTADIKRHARLNCIAHLLDQFDYPDEAPEPIDLPPRPEQSIGYIRPPLEDQTFVPARY